MFDQYCLHRIVSLLGKFLWNVADDPVDAKDLALHSLKRVLPPLAFSSTNKSVNMKKAYDPMALLPACARTGMAVCIGVISAILSAV